MIAMKSSSVIGGTSSGGRAVRRAALADGARARHNRGTMARSCLPVVICAGISSGWAWPAHAARAESSVSPASSLRAGLVLQIGPADGGTLVAQHAGGWRVVHALDRDAGRVAEARVRLLDKGVYGPVTVEQWNGALLPHADGLVNLVVAEDLGRIAESEVMRVLAPGGVARICRDGRWVEKVKSHPPDTDEWTHSYYDASGNAVSRDRAVGPPAHVQWIAEPRHARSHEHLPSINAVVSSAGRLFYIADEGATGFLREAASWRLVARDAHNGLPLWRRRIDGWESHMLHWGNTPSQLERRLVAVGDRVFVTLGLHAPVSALDAATGETLRVYDGTEGAEEIAFHRGVLLLVCRRVTEERVAEMRKWERLAGQAESPLFRRTTQEPLIKILRAADKRADLSILALDAGSGRLLWRKEGAATEGLDPDSLRAIDDIVLYQRQKKEIVCMALKTGDVSWKKTVAPMLAVRGDMVLCAKDDRIVALSPKDGAVLWQQEPLLCSIRDAFAIGDSVWLGGFKPWQGQTSGKRGPSWGPYFMTQRDLATGEVRRHIEPEGPGHHHRCWKNKATERFVLGGRRGVEFIDLASGDVLWHNWIRGVCKYGVMPANGLLYVPPHACGCYITAKLAGFYALAPRGSSEGGKGQGKMGPRLEKGPAFGEVRAPSAELRDPADWPTYRGDAARSGSAASAVPARLKVSHRVEIGGILTAPTVAGGKVFVASRDAHRLCAVDIASGEIAWEFIAGARIDSPPTIHGGRVLFGCRDGHVYSLRASDGALDWRFRAASEDRRIVALGQLESAAPVPGAVLLHDGAACFTAGRSSYLDGGIMLYRLVPETGEVLSETKIYSPDPETGRQPPQYGPNTMPGALADILSADGDRLYLRDMAFAEDGSQLDGDMPHLLTLTGFLDDSWAHRSYWIYGTNCSIATGCSARSKSLTYGRLLSLDDSAVYGYGRSNVHWSDQLEDGAYRLFARDRAGDGERWAKPLPIHVRAMALAGATLFVAGPAVADPRQSAPLPDGSRAFVMAVSAASGEEQARLPVDGLPVFDGMAAANGMLFITTEAGQLLCLGE